MKKFVVTKEGFRSDGSIATFSCDEDRIEANNLQEAEIILKSKGIDQTHKIQGELIQEEEVSDDTMLDIMLANRVTK